ncbi:MAG TPA: glycine cleavage system aminomethyltransferase GcvT [Gammaproteobacteria bacterium]|nr:glycine cleavage system aminomethyltransferase GcvT [Gammaproteobacteria bacterium]
MPHKTCLYDCHLQSSAKMVNFAGWDMPLHYGSQLQEHHQVRQDAGLFDVSHMTIVDFTGPDVATFLRYLLANNIDRLTPGKALYTCLLNEKGGILDDLIVYHIADHFYRLIVNSATREKDLTWFQKQMAGYDVNMTERRDQAMIAVQGPHARTKLATLFTPERQQALFALKPFTTAQWDDLFIAATGYTGEDGVEMMLPAVDAPAFWQRCLLAGIKPAGLGARDTLRLEAGLNLYGSDMDETVTPLESNLAWTVAFEPKERDFIGRQALLKQQAEGVTQKLVALVLEGSGVLRNHQKIQIGTTGTGEITSGSFSPTLNKGIALARVPVNTGDECSVEIRGKAVPARIIKPPFVRHGKKTFSETVERQQHE